MHPQLQSPCHYTVIDYEKNIARASGGGGGCKKYAHTKLGVLGGTNIKDPIYLCFWLLTSFFEHWTLTVYDFLIVYVTPFYLSYRPSPIPPIYLPPPPNPPPNPTPPLSFSVFYRLCSRKCFFFWGNMFFFWVSAVMNLMMWLLIFCFKNYLVRKLKSLPIIFLYALFFSFDKAFVLSND